MLKENLSYYFLLIGYIFLVVKAFFSILKQRAWCTKISFFLISLLGIILIVQAVLNPNNLFDNFWIDFLAILNLQIILIFFDKIKKNSVKGYLCIVSISNIVANVLPDDSLYKGVFSMALYLCSIFLLGQIKANRNEYLDNFFYKFKDNKKIVYALISLQMVAKICMFNRIITEEVFKLIGGGGIALYLYIIGNFKANSNDERLIKEISRLLFYAILIGITIRIMLIINIL